MLEKCVDSVDSESLVIALREAKLEELLKKTVERIGGKTFKFISPGNNGVPDRIVLYQGNVFFVELKSPGGNLRPLQKAKCREFERLGFHVYVIDSVETLEAFINEICTA